MEAMTINAFEEFHHGWALLTAGTMDHYNTMTISWGNVGCLWNLPTVTVYVRPNRYTWEFMEAHDTFTVSFYPEEQRQALALLGRVSGRDRDKVGESGLTPVEAGAGVTFAQAKKTLVCKKLYSQDMEAEKIPEDIFRRFFEPGEQPHRIYIGQILEVLTPETGA